MKPVYPCETLWFLVFLFLTLTGCGPSGSSTTGTNNTTSTTTTPTSTTTSAATNTTTANTNTVDFTITPNSGWLAPGTFVLDASATTIPDVISYHWSITDNTGSEIQTLSGVKTSIVLQNPGPYAVTLTVTDKMKKESVVKKGITLESAIPAQEINFTAVPDDDTQHWVAPGTFVVDATNAVSYDWPITNSSGSEVQKVSGDKTSIALQKPGTYTVTLTVTDAVGKTRIAKKQIVLASAIPAQEIDFTITPLPIGSTDWLAPGSFEVDASSTPNEVSYEWSVADSVGTEVQTASGVKTSIALLNPGTYTVKLTVTNTTGITGTATKQITLMKSSPNVVPTFSATQQRNSYHVKVDASTATRKSFPS